MYILYKCIFLKGRAEHNQAAAPKSLRDSKSMQTSEGDKGGDTEMNTEVFSVRGASRGPGGGGEIYMSRCTQFKLGGKRVPRDLHYSSDVTELFTRQTVGEASSEFDDAAVHFSPAH